MAVKEKELELVHDRMNMYKFQFKNGGEIPAALQGNWTNKTQAQAAAESYMNNRRAYPARGRSGKKSGS